MLYFTFVKSEPEYSSVAWDSIMIVDSNEPESMLREFTALCHNTFFLDIQYQYNNILEELNWLTVYQTSAFNKCLESR
jgi:hypothetical protein